jgi:hypothetical protein
MSYLSSNGGGTFVCISSNWNNLFNVLKRPKVLIVEPAHTSSCIVFCNGVKSGFRARVCTFALAGVWSELAESRNDSDSAWASMVLAASRASSSVSHCGKPLQGDPLRVRSLHFNSLHSDRLWLQIQKFASKPCHCGMQERCERASRAWSAGQSLWQVEALADDVLAPRWTSDTSRHVTCIPNSPSDKLIPCRKVV